MAINSYFENSQLAYAAYAKLDVGMTPETYLDRLGASNVNMSETQATQFTSRYEVIHQQPNTDTGFSATLFWDWDKAQYAFAIRGTELGDFTQDVLLTDLADIGGKGIAARQGVDLFNYYQRLITPAGDDALQLELVIRTSAYPPADVNYTVLESGSKYSEYMYLETAPSAEGLGLLSSGEQLNVAGHSLGGHLGMMMARMFPGSVNEVYTYNAPGFDRTAEASETEWFFDAIAEAQIRETGGTTVDLVDFPDTKFTNLFVPGDWVSTIGTIPGGQITHYGEGDGAYSAHKIAGVTDALAVYDLLAGLDTNENKPIEELTPILQAAGYDSGLLDNNRSLENIVNAMGDLFDPAGEKVTPENRDGLYKRIKAIQESSLYTTNEGRLSVVSTAGVTDEAQTDLAYRYAVVNLNPFAILGDDTLYAQFETELALYNPASRTGNLTENYITDKSYFLNQLVEYNRSDDDDTVSANSTEYFFDYQSYSEINHDLKTNNVNAGRYIFADDKGKKVAGGEGADHLYGGAGNDILMETEYPGSDTSDDYLEGGAGNDSYYVGGGDILHDFMDAGGRLMHGVVAERTRRKHLNRVFSK